MFKKEGNNIYWFLPGRFVHFFVKRATRKRKKLLKKKISRLEHDDFTIVCNNCIAGSIYHDYGLEFKTPFINVFIESEDFFRLIANFQHYMLDTKELVDITTVHDTYPVGLLDDIKIRFVHYNDFLTASRKWFDRAKRINYNHLFFMMSDIDWGGKDIDKFVEEDKIKGFLERAPKKFYFFTNDPKKQCINDKRIVFLKKYSNNKPFYYGSIELFGKGQTCLEHYFDVIEWINRCY